MLQTFTVLAGGRQIDAKANFFRYEMAGLDSADQYIRVRADGNDLGAYLPGDSIELPIFAKRWEIVPASATQTATVRLGHGKVTASRLSGVVSVTNRIGSGIVQSFGTLPLTVGTNVQQIIAPAANARGLLIRTTSTQATAPAGGTCDTRIVFAPSAPANLYPANGYSLCRSFAPASTAAGNILEQLNFQIPAGWGMWACTAVTGVAATSASYEFAHEPL